MPSADCMQFDGDRRTDGQKDKSQQSLVLRALAGGHKSHNSNRGLHTVKKKYRYIGLGGYFMASFPYFNGTGSVGGQDLYV